MLLKSVWMIGKNSPHWRRRLGHRGVFQVFAKGGVAPLVSFEAVGQEVRASLDIGLEERPELGAGSGRQHGDAGIPGIEAVLALHRVAVLALLVLGRRHLLDRTTTRLLSGFSVLRPGLDGSTLPPMKLSSASRKPLSG